MNSVRYLRPALPLAAVLLCGLLTSCSGGSGSPSPSPSPAARAAKASPKPTAKTAMRTTAPSQLCTVLDLATARKVLTGLRYSPEVSPNKGAAPDACSYATGDGKTLLSLSPTTRPYATELTMTHSLIRNPAASGMRDVQVQEISGLGQAAFKESAYAIQQRQTITWVVWRSGSKSWVLSLAQITATDSPSRLVPVAQQIAPRLPR
jgi:hypothetical protein